MSTAPPTREPLVALAQDADLLPVGARVLVAVSAGRDSTALACVLAALREALVTASDHFPVTLDLEI